MIISVIIPVYNGERHIGSCYQSLCRQTYPDWEAVFINDGSTDRTSELLSNIGSTDSRVKVIHKNNEGVAVARERGIAQSTGGIITFLDVDDTLADNALRIFADTFNASGADIVVSGINLISEEGALIKSIEYKPESMSGDTATAMLCDGRLRWQLWAKAFKRGLLTNVVTPAGLRSAEDMAVCLQAVAAADKVCALGCCLYNYMQVATSVTHAKAQEISMDALSSENFAEKVAGARIGKENTNCMFMLIISGALRSGISDPEKIFHNSISRHFSIASLRRLSFNKAVNVLLFKLFRINLAKYL